MHNSILSKLSLIPFFALLLLIGLSNHTFGGVENSYSVNNLDPVLINGKKYDFYSHNINGHQFLNDNSFSEGEVTINGEVYTDLMLNLDIYNQQLIMLFKSPQGSDQVIVMSDAWIESFRINNQIFEYRILADGSKKIFQVVGSKNIKVLYRWSKLMALNSSSGKHHFSHPNKEAFLLIDDEIKGFKKNRSFINCFSEDKKPQLKKHLKANKIKVSRLNDSEMESLIDYCNTLYLN
jgi:hypothetical protein